MRPVFADPKTDFVFKRIFGGRPSGSEPRKHLLIQLLNALLELAGKHEIKDLTYLPPGAGPGTVPGSAEVARVANFTAEEWESDDRAKMAEQDLRGVVSAAQKEGLERGRSEGRAEGQVRVLLRLVEQRS